MESPAPSELTDNEEVDEAILQNFEQAVADQEEQEQGAENPGPESNAESSNAESSNAAGKGCVSAFSAKPWSSLDVTGEEQVSIHLPPACGDWRRCLFSPEGVRLTPAEYSVYWPYVDNVWSKRAVHPYTPRSRSVLSHWACWLGKRDQRHQLRQAHTNLEKRRQWAVFDPALPLCPAKIKVVCVDIVQHVHG